MLQDRFNQADRSQDDWLIDGDITSHYHYNAEHRFSLSFGRSQRAPTFIERYNWLPMPTSGGLADGNTYVGDLNLKPETAYQVNLGWRYQHNAGFIEPHVFVRYIEDYIQGTPTTDPTTIMISTGNGDPTPLQWSNVDALIIGGDLQARQQIGALNGGSTPPSATKSVVAPITPKVARTCTASRHYSAAPPSPTSPAVGNSASN